MMQNAAIHAYDTDQDDAVAHESERQKMQEQLAKLVGNLTSEAERRISRRHLVEQRWLRNLRQYHGVYDDNTKTRLEKAMGSQVFANLTRAKTNAMTARLMDLLFPTDDRNWQIAATPVPKMGEEAERAMAEAARLAKQAEQDAAEADQAMADGNRDAAAVMEQQSAQGRRQASEARAAADRLQEIMNEATVRAHLMQEQIDDQLKTCRWQAQCRDMIEDACKMGTGVMKGPVIGHKSKEQWQQAQAEDGSTVYVLATAQDNMPAAQRVDPWSFFPDPDVRTPEDSEGFFERHLMNKKALRDLAKRPDIDEDVVREILQEEPTSGSKPSYLSELVNITEGSTESLKDHYTVWEYTGPIDSDDLEMLALSFDDEATAIEAAEADPLMELQARIWFCGDKILSFALHPLDSNAPLYSVYNLEREEAGPWGYGIPELMSDEQSILNASMRMMMDNAALSVGPQIVVNKEVVEPEDGSWVLSPRKIWQRKSNAPANQPPFETYNIPINQQQLENIIGMARQFIDEVTSMPQIAQGEQGAGVTKTAQGMALLMNSANVVFRRVVKNFDDDITVPLITRFYHWNMQFSDREEIKGDLDVVARGSSVLLVREMQANNLMMIAQMFGNHPRIKDYDLMQAIFRAHMISATEVLRTDSEYDEYVKQQAGQQDPKVMEIQLKQAMSEQDAALQREDMQHKKELAQMEWDARTAIAQMNFDATMTKLAESLNMSRDDLDARIAMNDAKLMEDSRQKAEDRRSKDRGLATEVAMAQRTGVSSGGAI